jgi:hypothetical protein
MIGDPAQFEAIGNRLGFRVVEESADKLRLYWQGPRFPAYLCFGIALLLLVVSVPIVQALLLRGFVGPAGSLWYFPLMNLVLFGIAFFLLTQRRMIEIDGATGRLTLRRVSLYRSTVLEVNFAEIKCLTLSNDQIYSGFAIGGSTAAQTFPIPALRLFFSDGENVLLDRSSLRRLTELGRLVSKRVMKSLEVDPELQNSVSANPEQTPRV